MFGPFQLLPQRRQLLRNGQALRLGSRAMEILVALAGRPGEVISKSELIAAGWPGSNVDEGNLRVHVAALRKLLGDDPASDAGEHYIHNSPLRGYSFVAPVRREWLPNDRAAHVHATALPRAQAVESPHNLPGSLCNLVGREAALSQLLSHLPVRRFITLAGPAGIGKTALALAVADSMRAACTDGVWWVDLAPVREPSLVPSALATALGMPLLSGDHTREVASGLRKRRLMVVLDNCEHVVEAAAQLAEALLATAPDLLLLATSREPLRAMGEWVQRLSGLTLNALDPPCSSAQALAYPAVALLVERAAAASDGFRFTDAEVPAALQLCQKLDGIPLAIELVATRTATFGLQGLADRLDDHMALMTQGRRTALPRHKTLHAALDWSHALLSPDERCVFRRLSLFRDRFSLGSACKMAADSRIKPSAVREAVAGLVAKSLLAIEVGDDIQYRMLETTRRYAAEKLVESNEMPSLRRRHAECVTEWLETAERDLQELTAPVWRSRHGSRIDDVRAALDWAVGHPAQAALAAALTAAAAPLFFHLGLVHECKERVERVTDKGEELPPDELRDMRLELARGHAHLHTAGATAQSEISLNRSLAIATRMGCTHDRLRALWGLFAERMMRADYAAAHAVACDFGAAIDGLDDRPATLTLHRMQALALYMLAQHPAARKHAELALQQPAIDIRFLHGSAYQVDHQSSALTPMARILWIQGHASQAAAAACEAVDRASKVEHGFSLTYALALAAIPIALWAGDLPAAEQYLNQLRDCTKRHSLSFWQTWCSMYERVLTAAQDPAGSPEWMAQSASHPGRADMLSTLGLQLVPPLARRRAEAGLNPWCTAEIQRAATEAAWLSGQCTDSQAETGFLGALGIAQQQGALAWELRAATNLCRLRRRMGTAYAAATVLEEVIKRFPPNSGSRDLQVAQEMTRA
jgi:predicted ATPase/DNA-binding winged helix-turn-helix (wHTH) protein